MPLYSVETRKATQQLGGRRWRNRYFVEAASLTAALDAAATIWVSGEREFHYQDVYCYEVYANEVGDVPFTPGATQATSAFTAFGLVPTLGRGELLPSFNVVRVDFPVALSRPSRKFYRPMLREGDTNGDLLVGQILIDLFEGLMNIAGDTIRDPDNQPWQAGGFSIRSVSSRRLGRDSFINVPSPPVAEP